MSPDEAISLAARCASRGCEGDVMLDAWEPFLGQVDVQVSDAREAVRRVALAKGQGVDAKTAAALEAQAFVATLQMAVTALMAFAHLPYLAGARMPAEIQGLS